MKYDFSLPRKVTVPEFHISKLLLSAKRKRRKGIHRNHRIYKQLGNLISAQSNLYPPPERPDMEVIEFGSISC
jgi:hypothetical protein